MDGLTQLLGGPAMPLQLAVGDRFPDLTMVDDRGQSRSIAEVADGRPLFLAFFRGPW